VGAVGIESEAGDDEDSETGSACAGAAIGLISTLEGCGVDMTEATSCAQAMWFGRRRYRSTRYRSEPPLLSLLFCVSSESVLTIVDRLASVFRPQGCVGRSAQAAQLPQQWHGIGGDVGAASDEREEKKNKRQSGASSHSLLRKNAVGLKLRGVSGTFGYFMADFQLTTHISESCVTCH